MVPSTLEEPQDDNVIAQLLDKQSDTKGLSNIDTEHEDWTDVKHSERKKRDRILADKVLLELIQKSDYEGFKRLFTNLGILALTGYCIHRLEIFPFDQNKYLSLDKDNEELWKLATFIPAYVFYGFQIQCFAFAGQHEFLHRNAWKTRWINDWVLFVVGTACFEFGKHEQMMHKQHHTFTNNIDKDPELTSFYSREELENPEFRNVNKTKFGFFRQFLYVWPTFKCRICKLISSALGIAVDYTGTGWSMQTPKYSKESGIMQDLKAAARLQLLVYAAIFGLFGQTSEGCQALMFWWIVPVLVGYAPVNFVRNLEHADCEVSKEMNCLRNTRTVRSNAILRQLLWNTNYHAEHHCYPMVPFFNLPKLSELMDAHVIHNECRHFSTQNWEAVKPGGWIDQQAMGLKKRD